MSDEGEFTIEQRAQLRAAKWRAFLWVTAGCLVIGVAQCALLQIR